MTHFEKKRFTGPQGTSRPDLCAQEGHIANKVRSDCYRCGRKLEPGDLIVEARPQPVLLPAVDDYILGMKTDGTA